MPEFDPTEYPPFINTIEDLPVDGEGWVGFDSFYRCDESYYLIPNTYVFGGPRAAVEKELLIKVVREQRSGFTIDLMSCPPEYTVPESPRVVADSIYVNEVIGLDRKGASVQPVDEDGWPIDPSYEDWGSRKTIKSMSRYSVGWAEAQALIQRFSGQSYLRETMVVYEDSSELEGREFLVIYKSGGGNYYVSTQAVLDNISFNDVSLNSPGLVKASTVDNPSYFPGNGYDIYRQAAGEPVEDYEEVDVSLDAALSRSTNTAIKSARKPRPKNQQRRNLTKKYQVKTLPAGQLGWVENSALKWIGVLAGTTPYLNLRAYYTMQRVSETQQTAVMHLGARVYVADVSRVAEAPAESKGGGGKTDELVATVAISKAPIFFVNDDVVVTPEEEGDVGVDMNRFSQIKIDD